MFKADNHVVREQCNEENPKGPCLLCSQGDHNILLPARDSWRVNTAHVSSFVLISILRGQPRTPPSGDNLGVLDYHLNAGELTSMKTTHTAVAQRNLYARSVISTAFR